MHKPKAPNPEAGPQPTDPPTRDSQVRPRSPMPVIAPSGSLSPLSGATPASGIDRGLREVRKRAVTLRQQGWKWELQGRAAAFREAAVQVRRWLLRDAPPSMEDVRFVIKLLEQTAEVYEADETGERPGAPGDDQERPSNKPREV